MTLGCGTIVRKAGRMSWDEFEEADWELQEGTDVRCPWCGEAVSITLDPTAGAEQDYVEDCAVCCRPWRVHVTVDDSGSVAVNVEPDE